MIFIRFITLLLFLALAGCQSGAAKKQSENNIDKRAKLHYSLGIEALHKDFLPKAFEELMLSDSINPNQSATLDAIAVAWRVHGNNQKAKKYYELAIDADKDADSATRNNYGSLLIEMGEYKEAVQQLNIALEDPRYRNQPLAFTNLGDALVGLKDLEAAVSAYRKAQMLAPDWSQPKLHEAAAYATFNRPIYAQALYETILRKEPSNKEALVGLIPLLKDNSEQVLLTKYINTFIEKTTIALDKAWAKDELARIKE